MVKLHKAEFGNVGGSMICPLCTAGVQRFKMTKVVQERPILIAEVELLPEEEDISQEVNSFCNYTHSYTS